MSVVFFYFFLSAQNLQVDKPKIHWTAQNSKLFKMLIFQDSFRAYVGEALPISSSLYIVM